MTSAYRDVEELAAALLRRGGINTHPVPIERLALGLGADRILTERLQHEEGRLELRGSDVVIVTSRDASAARRRFTIAHEIGHLVVADPRYELRALRERAGLRSEERFCDRLAESLLMPAPWIRARYGAAPERLATVMECSRAFGVSAAAANLRLARCTGWSRALLRFNAYAGRWQLSAVTGWRPERRDCVHHSEWTDAVLNRFAEPGELSRLWLPLCCGEREWLFGTELWGRPGWALALVDPRHRRALAGATRRGEAAAISDAGVPEPLKLFYSLDDIDACILPASIEREGKDEGHTEDQEHLGGQPLAA